MSAITVIHEYRTRDKSDWGDGPWQSEPDKQQWIDDASGLDCLINRGPSGALCGYVGVTEGHPAFEMDYDNVYDLFPDWEDAGHLSVHGGLTFSNRCQEGAEEDGVCHTPVGERSDKVWWLGFDCAHSGDLCPSYANRFPPLAGADESYKDIGYVQREVAALAGQLGGLA